MEQCKPSRTYDSLAQTTNEKLSLIAHIYIKHLLSEAIVNQMVQIEKLKNRNIFVFCLI